MILDETVLQRLGDWQPPGGRQTLTVNTASGWSAAITADRHDELGSLVWEVALQRNQPSGGQTLTQRAQSVAGRVTGLLEQLKVVEIDLQKNEALLRSDEQGRRGERLAYYEVLLKNTSAASIRRFQALPLSGKRDQVAFGLTNEALAKLIADVTLQD